jgi:predicted ATP-dependent endonuclease of OLD family
LIQLELHDKLFQDKTSVTPTFDTLRDTERSSNSIILVEEPELGIHPHQFHLVMEFLKEVSTRNQVIITTHSPRDLDLVSKSELVTINMFI